jgi:hypothetical protein
LAIGAVDRAAEPVSGDRDGQAGDGGHGDAAGGVAEDQPFLLERLEQAAQGAGQVQAGLAGPLLEDGLDIVTGDLAQAGGRPHPVGEDGSRVAEIFADRLERHGAVLAAAFPAQDPDPRA